MKNKKKLLKDLGIAVGSTICFVGGGLSMTSCASSFSEMLNSNGKGLNLRFIGAHIKEGIHRVVISNQFWEAYIPEATEEDKIITINGMKKAYEDLNEACSNVSFELCSTEDEPSKYGVKKIEEIGKNDIVLYVSDIVHENPLALARTEYLAINPLTSEIERSSITFRKSALNASRLNTESLTPQFYVMYSLTIHESMHCMGFWHENSRTSVMYDTSIYGEEYLNNLKNNNYTCLSKEDRLALDKYCVTFYNAAPKYMENVKNVNANHLTKKTIEDEELCF